MFKRFVKALFALGTICGLSASHASAISLLSIEGVTGPGDVGTYPVDSGFSWIAHRYPDASVPHIWQLAAGSDGGIVLGQAQPGRGGITEVRPMYNINSWLYSVGSGVIFGSNGALDFSTMHLKWGETDLQFGISPGFDSSIPLVSDITQLAETENGYVVYGDGKYDLIYHDVGLCDGCAVTLHLHGVAMAVPEPENSVLWLLGLAAVSIRLFTRKK